MTWLAHIVIIIITIQWSHDLKVIIGTCRLAVVNSGALNYGICGTVTRTVIGAVIDIQHI